MTSMFDYDDSVNLVFDAKLAGKKLVTAKHELLTKTGDFLFLAHSERELAFRMQVIEEDIERTAHRRLASVSDSKAKLVRAVFDEWQLRHASCEFCKQAGLGDMINNLRGKGSNYGLTKDTSGNMTADRGGQTAQGGFQGSGCGTVSGFMAHQQAGTAPCRNCTMANNIQTQRMTRDQAPVGKAYDSDAQADKQ